MSNSPVTFDDIEKYDAVMYQGRLGRVIAKGPDILGSEGRHVKLLEEHRNGETSRRYIHESTVNNLLQERRSLWVDFTGGIDTQLARGEV